MYYVARCFTSNPKEDHARASLVNAHDAKNVDRHNDDNDDDNDGGGSASPLLVLAPF